MLNGKEIAVVLPAYNAEKTLRATVTEIPSCVQTPILVDDGSSDNTARVARELGSKFTSITGVAFRLQKLGLARFKMFDPEGLRITRDTVPNAAREVTY